MNTVSTRTVVGMAGVFGGFGFGFGFGFTGGGHE